MIMRKIRKKSGIPAFNSRDKKKKTKKNKKHSENTVTSTSVIFDLVVWLWPFVKVKKADVIRCRLLYCTWNQIWYLWVYYFTRYHHLCLFNYTITKSWRGYIFTPVCLCVCVCLSLCVSVCPDFLWTKFRPNAQIWTLFLLNGCLQLWLEPYWNWWPWVKGPGHSDSIWLSIFSS